MMYDVNELNIMNKEKGLSKALNWREELHPRDQNGRFVSGHKYTAIRNGAKVVAKNGTKGKVVGSSDTHYHIEKVDGKVSKVLKGNVIHENDHTKLTKPAKKATAKKTAAPKKQPAAKPKTKGASANATNKKATTSKPKPGTSTATSKKVNAGANGAPTKRGTQKRASEAKAATTRPQKVATQSVKRKQASEAKKPAAKANKDIRTEVQKNRKLAYDAGVKVGGARKDEYERYFKEKPTLSNLANLEKESGALAQKLVTKKNVMPAFSFEEEHKNGVDLPTAILKKLIFDRVATAPEDNSAEARKAFVANVTKLHRHFAEIKSIDTMMNAVRELSDIGSKINRGKKAQSSVDFYNRHTSNHSYFNTEYYDKEIKAGKDAQALFDLTALGEKAYKFFSDYEARERTIKTVRRNAAGGWDKYLAPKEKKAMVVDGEKITSEERKRWERGVINEYLRKGGSPVKVSKPEEFLDRYGVRGVEFGHWVDDSSGKYHLQRCAEAFTDLADTLGIDEKDISLNGRLAIAFGARGKGGAKAHYEPAHKVINMTKYGGAGSLAHEWGHALDNLMNQYSHGGKESVDFASEATGDHDPKLQVLYKNLMDKIRNPLQFRKVTYEEHEIDTSKELKGSYRKHYVGVINRRRSEGKSDEAIVSELMEKWKAEDEAPSKKRVERYKELLQNTADKKARQRLNRELNKYTRALRKEQQSIADLIGTSFYVANGHKHWQGTVKVPKEVERSNYYQSMVDEDGGTDGKYWSKNEEMFARVFEAYVQDKMASNGQRNNYLVEYTKASPGAPFPDGSERKVMFKAMEHLLTYITSKGALKKALKLDLMKSMSTGISPQRSAYVTLPQFGLFHIPINRLSTPYQTSEATDMDKVTENMERMQAGEVLEPVVVGYDYDVHDGHHRLEASKRLNYTHVPCIVMEGPNEIDRVRAIEAYDELWKSFNAADHPRDEKGRFTLVYHTTKDKDFRFDPTYKNAGQEWGQGLYTAPIEDMEYWNFALKDKVTGEGHPYVMPLDVSEAKLLHVDDIPDEAARAKAIITHFGSDSKRALKALEDEERNHVTGETYDKRPHEIAMYRLYAKANGYDGLIAHDQKEGHQVVLFNDDNVKYGKAIPSKDVIRQHKRGQL